MTPRTKLASREPPRSTFYARLVFLSNYGSLVFETPPF
jgi:hypothetical protein